MMKSCSSQPVIAPSQKESRQRGMDELLGYILFGGVLISMALIAIGLFWRYVVTGKVSLDYQIVGMNMAQFVVAELRAVAAGRFRPRIFVSLGIVILMLTPYFRVAASVVYFIAGLKNWKYSAFTGFVLAVLTYSLFLR
jgi:uncharacterized membrane protein